jgi:hypothetical protein
MAELSPPYGMALALRRFEAAKWCAGLFIVSLSAPFAGCAADSAVGTGGAIWTDQDQAIEIDWDSYWVGGYKLKRERDQLSAEQLQRLREIRTIEVTNMCPTDIETAQLVVTDAQAKPRRYVANAWDADCSDEEIQVGYGPLSAFLSTAKCLSAKQRRSDSLDEAPHVAVGDGCSHGIFGAASAAPPHWWFWVDVKTAGLHRFAIQDCLNRQLRLGVFDAAGETLLRSVDFTDGSCPVLEYDISEPDTYALNIEMIGGAPVGDFYLTVDRLP